MSDTPSGGFRIPSRIDRVLMAAAQSPGLLEDLKLRRSAAAVEAGFELTQAERAVLDATGPEQLETMISRLPPAPTPPGLRMEEEVMFGGIRPDDDRIYEMHQDVSRGTRPVLPIALAAAGTVLLGGAAAGMLIVTGSRPDEPLPIEKPLPVSTDGGAGDGDAGDGGDANDADADASDSHDPGEQRP